MTGPTAITETCAELEGLLTKATKGPWAYRPTVYDDWGWIRGTEIDGKMGRYQPIVAHARNSEVTYDQEGAHRLAGTDPYGPNAELIVAAVNALPSLIATIREQSTALAEADRKNNAILAEWNAAEATIRHLSEALRPFANADIDISGTAAIGVTADDILAARAALNSGEG